mmetsp:Transcript_75617/g.177533  ORF Transcript_75617/g.177533 Transcript_75617/m.177533 type:complete len:189 (-) Transcript_75617:147-713(-)
MSSSSVAQIFSLLSFHKQFVPRCSGLFCPSCRTLVEWAVLLSAMTRAQAPTSLFDLPRDLEGTVASALIVHRAEKWCWSVCFDPTSDQIPDASGEALQCYHHITNLTDKMSSSSPPADATIRLGESAPPYAASFSAPFEAYVVMVPECPSPVLARLGAALVPTLLAQRVFRSLIAGFEEAERGTLTLC